MNVREWMNNNSALVTIIAVVVLVVCLGLIIWQMKPTTYEPVDVYYYDLTSGTVFAAGGEEMPPIPAPSQGTYNGHDAGVRAHVYACGECPGDLTGKTIEQIQQEGAFVAYLEMYSPEVKQAIQQQEAAAAAGNVPEGGAMDYMMGPGVGTLVSPPGAEPQWFPMYSEPGMALMENATRQCADAASARSCRP